MHRLRCPKPELSYFKLKTDFTKQKSKAPITSSEILGKLFIHKRTGNGLDEIDATLPCSLKHTFLGNASCLFLYCFKNHSRYQTIGIYLQ